MRVPQVAAQEYAVRFPNREHPSRNTITCIVWVAFIFKLRQAHYHS
jgi:hypothetical protein